MRNDVAKWQPYREPLRATLARNGVIAVVAGSVLALSLRAPARLPVAVLWMLWPSLGGHSLEVLFLNYLRFHLPGARAVQTAVRPGVWFLGGVMIAGAMRLTAMHLPGFRLFHLPAWWLAGLAFIAIELTAHAVLQARGLASFYNGRG